MNDVNGLFNFKRSTQALRFRSVLLLLVAFMTYFVLAKPAMASAHQAGVMKMASVGADHKVHLDQMPMSDEGQQGEGDSDSDCASFDLEMDDFVAPFTHFEIVNVKPSFEVRDLRLSLPSFDRGVDYPPEA